MGQVGQPTSRYDWVNPLNSCFLVLFLRVCQAHTWLTLMITVFVYESLSIEPQTYGIYYFICWINFINNFLDYCYYIGRF